MNATHNPASESLRGKRYIAYARCAPSEGSPQKLQEQIRLIREFGDSLNMRCVDEVRLTGIGGGAPALRPDLCALLSRKREVGDFEVLMMEDVARLTRTGLEGASEIEAEFRKHGVEIVYLTAVRQGRESPRAASARDGRGTAQR